MSFNPGAGVQANVWFGGGGVAPQGGSGVSSAIQVYNVVTYGTPTNGNDIVPTINALVNNTIGGADATLYFPPGSYGLGQDLTLPSNIRVWMAKGAQFVGKVANRTLTINGNLDAGLGTVFNYPAIFDFTVVFGPNVALAYMPQWWGAKGDGVTDDSQAFQRTINAAPNNALILFPPRANYLLSSATPTILNRSDLTFTAYGATITLAGAGRMALLLSGANTRTRWFGGRIIGSNVLGDDHQAIGTVLTPPSGTITSDLFVYDVNIQDVVRGVYINVSSLGDATDITFRRIVLNNIIGPSSGQGYGLVMSGVWGGAIDDCRGNLVQRHAFYISVCKDINLSKLRTKNHSGTIALSIARSCDIQGSDLSFDNCTAGNPIMIEPHESDTTADTGRIQLSNISCTNTVAGQQDILIGGATPATSSILYDVKLNGVAIKRLATETATGVESIIVRHGTNIKVKDVHYLAPAALTVTKTVVYLSAQGGAAYTDSVTVEGVRGRAPNLAAGGYLVGVEVGAALCGGTQRLTIRDNECKAVGGSIGQAVAYDAARTNPNIESRFNRCKGPNTGTAVLVAGTVTVAAPEILTGDIVLLTRLTAGGTRGHLALGAIVNGTSFVISSDNAADTSTILWEIIH